MNQKQLKLFAGSVAAIMMSLAAPAYADDATAEDIARFVKVCDTSKDGMLSKAEVMKRAADMFDKMDTGKKGMVDEKKAIAQLLELQKTDGGSVLISRTDYLKKIDKTFDMADTNKKGMIDSKQAMFFLKELMKSGA